MVLWWKVAGLAGFTSSLYCIYTDNVWFYKHIVMGVFKMIDAETAHVMAIRLAQWGLMPKHRSNDDKILSTKLWGKELSNPIGLAAGFDKDAKACYNLFDIGFGFVEVGSITPLPQEGNPKPRVFRLSSDQAVINRDNLNSLSQILPGQVSSLMRYGLAIGLTDCQIKEYGRSLKNHDVRSVMYGFNSCGHADAAVRLKLWESKRSQYHGQLLGVNLGKNKNTEDAFSDYQQGIVNLGDFVDYIVINVSSPNTPGLRRMQEKEKLLSLLTKLLLVRDSLKNKPPLLVKVSPDLSQQEKEDIATVVCSKEAKVDGLIVSNTTLQRPPNLRSVHSSQKGGLSGQPLKDLSTQAVSDFYCLTKGTIPIIGVGGIASGQDAYEKILAGASVVQLYSALVYHAPVLIKIIKKDLAQILRNNGFSSVQEAVGKKHKHSNTNAITTYLT